VGSLQNFSAVFTGSLNVPAAGPVPFAFRADDACIFSVGNGATRVSGPQTNTPANSTFQSYPVMGGVNQRSAPATSSIVVNFPSGGVYPYEVDYAKGGDHNLTLTMSANGTPIPAAVILTMTPNTVPSTTAGQFVALTIQARDFNGAALPNVPVSVTITGVNSLVNGEVRTLITDGRILRRLKAQPAVSPTC
jgi:PA14 domain